MGRPAVAAPAVADAAADGVAGGAADGAVGGAAAAVPAVGLQPQAGAA